MTEKKEWWELLDWSEMKQSYKMLSESRRMIVLEKGFWSLGKGKFSKSEVKTWAHMVDM